MKNIILNYVSGLEHLPEEAVFKTLSDMEANNVDCVNWESYPYAPSVTFRIAYSDKALAVLFTVKEKHARGFELSDHGEVWNDSCVEVFIADPSGEGYYNFEVNCIGTRLAAKRKSKTDFELFDNERMAQFKTFGSLPHEHTDKDEAEWWMAEIIPFSLLGLSEAPKSLRANFYKCGDMCREPHFLSWSPIDRPAPEFHCPEFFGELTMTKNR